MNVIFFYYFAEPQHVEKRNTKKTYEKTHTRFSILDSSRNEWHSNLSLMQQQQNNDNNRSYYGLFFSSKH